MEVKEIKAENITSLEKLTEVVEYYKKIQDEISRLELSKKIAREAILERFRKLAIRVHDTDSGLRARVDTRKGTDFINIREAKQLLDADTFEKLRHEGTVSVVFSVRPVKAGEGQDA